MSDASWVQETMQATMREADMPFVEMNKKEKDYGLHPFSPDTLDHQEKKTFNAMFNRVAQSRPEWAGAVYKLALASSMRDHFQTYTYHASFSRLEACTPLLKAMPSDFRDALFVEMVQSLPVVARTADKDGKGVDPWGSYADGFYNSWAINHREDEVEAQTSLGLFLAWLDEWQNPFQEDLRLMSMIGGDVSSVGNWLVQEIANKEGRNNQQDDPQILLHELLDSPMPEGRQTDPRKGWQEDPTNDPRAAIAVDQENILPKQDAALARTDDDWNVGGLF